MIIPGQVKVIKTTTEGAAGEAFHLGQTGWTGFGRYPSTEAAIEAGKALGKDIEDVTLIESRGAYDVYVRGKIPEKERAGEEGYIEPGGVLLGMIFGSLISVLLNILMKPPKEA